MVAHRTPPRKLRALVPVFVDRLRSRDHGERGRATRTVDQLLDGRQERVQTGSEFLHLPAVVLQALFQALGSDLPRDRLTKEPFIASRPGCLLYVSLNTVELSDRSQTRLIEGRLVILVVFKDGQWRGREVGRFVVGACSGLCLHAANRL